MADESSIIISKYKTFIVLYMNRLEDNVYLLYALYGHAQRKKPCPWGHEIYNFSRPFLGHYY